MPEKVSLREDDLSWLMGSLHRGGEVVSALSSSSHGSTVPSWHVFSFSPLYSTPRPACGTVLPMLRAVLNLSHIKSEVQQPPQRLPPTPASQWRSNISAFSLPAPTTGEQELGVSQQDMPKLCCRDDPPWVKDDC